jgi:hypothetical protein
MSKTPRHRIEQQVALSITMDWSGLERRRGDGISLKTLCPRTMASGSTMTEGRQLQVALAEERPAGAAAVTG